jgi:hypothetical protein
VSDTSNYFEDQINSGQPIVPPSPEISMPVPTPPTESTPPVESDDWKGTPVRSNGDRVFLLKDGKKYWVTNAEVYNRLGFKFGDEVKLDDATLAIIPEGEPIK